MEDIKKFCESVVKALPATNNSLALGVFDMQLSPAVEHDADKVPVAWRIFKYGKNEIYQNGNRFSLNFSDEVFDSIIAYFAEKGTQIPLDSRHFLYRLAEHYGVSETELLKVLPDGRGTFGFGSLEKRSDGLWLVNVEYVPLARKLMADGSFRYFSPVIRGLADGQFRVTSVAMMNEPALNNLDSLAASADNDKYATLANINESLLSLDVLAMSANKEDVSSKDGSMKKVMAALAVLLATDTLALGADNKAPEGLIGKIEGLGKEMTTLRAGKEATDGLLNGLRTDLALGADANLETVQAGLKGIFSKADSRDALQKQVDTLVLGAETDKKAKLIKQGKADGKLNAKQVKWAKGLDSVALSAYLDNASKNSAVPLDNLERENLETSGASETKRKENYTLALGANDVSGAIDNCPIIEN